MQNRSFPYVVIIVLLVLVVIFLFLQKRSPKLPKAFPPYKSSETPQPSPSAGQKTIQEVRDEYEDDLFSYEGVNAVGIGLCDNVPCIKVSLEKETPESKNIPKEIEGYKVEIEVVGLIKPL